MSCGCHCTPCEYGNGLIPVLLAQLLIMAAFSFSFLTTWDCHFVTVEASRVAGALDVIESLGNNVDLVASNSTTRGLGFFHWEGIDGECTPRQEYSDEGLFELYLAFLGTDWDVPLVLAALSLGLTFVLMIWLFLFSCIAHPQGLRSTMAVIFLVAMPILQSLPFLLLRSDFCEEYECSLGRTGRFAAGATSAFFCIGVAFLFMQPYPRPSHAEHPAQPVEQPNQHPMEDEKLNHETQADMPKDKLNHETQDDMPKDNKVEANVY